MPARPRQDRKTITTSHSRVNPPRSHRPLSSLSSVQQIRAVTSRFSPHGDRDRPARESAKDGSATGSLSVLQHRAHEGGAAGCRVRDRREQPRQDGDGNDVVAWTISGPACWKDVADEHAAVAGAQGVSGGHEIGPRSSRTLPRARRANAGTKRCRSPPCSSPRRAENRVNRSAARIAGKPWTASLTRMRISSGQPPA